MLVVKLYIKSILLTPKCKMSIKYGSNIVDKDQLNNVFRYCFDKK